MSLDVKFHINLLMFFTIDLVSFVIDPTTFDMNLMSFSVDVDLGN